MIINKMIKEFSIKVTRYRKPRNMDVNEEFQFFSDSLGLFNDRDKEKSCFRIFLELIKASNHDHLLSSDNIADRSNLSRATVIHHMDKLIDSGLVVSRKEGYLLKADNFDTLLDQLKDEVNITIENLRESAKNINLAKERLNKEYHL